MNQLVHADIFFFITSIAVVLITIVAVIFLVYAIKILQEVRALVKFLHEEAEKISGDLADVRAKLQAGGLIGWLVQMFIRRKNSRRNQE